ncbi:O-antigen ligase family protein [Flavobacterium agricola]|uniref:O-antigen ligase family protein n=1 Tax=Flavobacterium agricola TaxID=2870839 RepID=A0ABY6LXA6_9FLAO|nr:O-antigen ligase family protein [Flavobacterium agricola]UYW00964.1 O-antigen ligase family protein [Flavobacterium agricola]
MLKKLFTQNNIKRTQNAVTCLAIISLPLSMALPNIFLIISVLLLIINNEKLKYKEIIPITVFVLATAFIELINKTFISDIKILSRLLLIILFTIVLLNSKVLYVKKAIIVSANLAIVISLIKIASLYITLPNVDLSNGELIFNVIYLDRPFLGFFIFISSMITINLLQNKEINKKLAFVIIAVNILFVFFIAARLTILTYLISGIVYYYFFTSYKTYVKLLITSLICISFVTLAVTNDNIRNRFKLENGIDSFVDYEPRFIIWPCSVKVIDDGNIFIGGKSNENLTSELINCYSSKITNQSKKDWFIDSKFNSHNQFLYIIMTTGILGLLFFLYFLISLWKNTNGSFYKISLFIGFVLFLILDCVLNRQVGSYFAALIITLIYFVDKSKKPLKL